ncbi:MAG TPA: NAD(P)-binding protein [Micromonosporaceae bacterium]|nr:NAD(P)-binding protein [Micromonosporaceae bacterium]
MTTDLPFAITLDVGTSLANKTGTWRTQLPVYVSRRPPCATACPAGEDPQKWLYQAEDGDYETAWRTIMAVNPFPAVIGRVCFHPCQTSCNRAQLDEAVGINSVERFIGDEALRRGWTMPVAVSTGRRVLVIGAGPAGMTAAYQLARLGHTVVVKESAPHAGGMLTYGIPRYRLPRDIVDAEIARIAAMGVTIELDSPVEDLAAELREGGWDAAFLAVGAQLGKRTDIPAGDSVRILDAIAMLHSVADDLPPLLGRRVVVYGGGDTAMDAARTARRIGATDATIVYRRTRDRMPAHPVELDEAEAEGVTVRWLSTISQVDADRIVMERMRLDDAGKPQPTGEYETLTADAVVLAIGQDTDLTLLDAVSDVNKTDGMVGVDQDFATGHRGLWAGGDIVADQHTVTAAIGHGTRAATAIHAYLGGSTGRPSVDDRAPADFGSLSTWYYSDAPASVRPQLEAARRVETFDEVVAGLTTETALYEARRCMSCGNCFECDSCYSVCPDNAVIKLGPGLKYAIDPDYCKGCGLCAAECPAGAIEMRPENS